MKRLASAALLTALALTLSGEPTVAEPASPHRFAQDRFVISFWVSPPNGEDMDFRYKELAEAGFTVVLGGIDTSTPDRMTKQLSLCQKHGLKALIRLPGYSKGGIEGASALDAVRESDRYPDHSVVWGYVMKDEPNADLFANMRFMVDHLRQTRPGKLTFINLYPDYATKAQLKADSYDEFLARFLSEVDPDVLCFDHYPAMTPKSDSRDGYCRNLAAVREHTLKAGIPFWNFFNSLPFGGHSDPTEAQLRWQIYTSLAYGAKGILYFCYWTPAGKSFVRGGAIITREGKRTRHYDQAKRINAAVNNLGPTLLQLTSTAVRRVTPDDDPAEKLKGSAIKSLTKGDYLIGEFAHADGRRAVLLNNYSFAYTSWPTVEFAASHDEVVEVDQQTSRETPLVDDSPAMAGLQVSLDSGAGRLFVLPAGKQTL